MDSSLLVIQLDNRPVLSVRAAIERHCLGQLCPRSAVRAWKTIVDSPPKGCSGLGGSGCFVMMAHSMWDTRILWPSMFHPGS